ncbi:hypothetical protein ACWELJ_21300 [Nocardia sp. NPDC004582]
MTTKEERTRAALTPPSSRSRRNLTDMPTPPGQAVTQTDQPKPEAIAPAPQPPVAELAKAEPAAASAAQTQPEQEKPAAEPKREPTAAAAPKAAERSPVQPAARKESAPETRKPAAAPRVATSGPADVARARLAARTAEQTFLPLVSRVAKLREGIEQAVLAVADAKAAGVTGEDLENTLRGITSKNRTAYTEIPESVRDAIQAADASEPGSGIDARARLAARTAEQTFLPLVSRVAKLREWSEQAVLAVGDAKAHGVEADELEDTLRAIVRKNRTGYTDIPESVRAAIAAD